MSMRTLIELNHDYADCLSDQEWLVFLARYLASGDSQRAKQLERFGCKVIGMRHHSDKFVIDDGADGFPPFYLKAAPPPKDIQG